ncbi:hypothetical protein FHETE_895 [Fusarium heterosporum]|uniref:N-acetyltransferase domain-containing protein n=1 Tax=Fusarium heterosporum TaxID=42747 RepID=A0A8H5U1R8_FUSHE|nr:hypothetical protein FHETE_895 [Fusarium heterosporum]
MLKSPVTDQRYHVRAGTFFDMPAVTRIYASAFSSEPLMDFLFPARKKDPVSFYTWAYRRMQCRYWTLGYSLRVIADKHDHPVGFSWWKRPERSYSLLQQILSPSFWIGPIINAFSAMRDYIFPVHGLDARNVEISKKAFSAVEPHVLDTPRRQEAQYLSLLAVDPVLQGQGLGKMLLANDLQKIDEENSAVWLVSLAGLEKFYAGYGFSETIKVEMEGLEDWEGGMVMLRD